MTLPITMIWGDEIKSEIHEISKMIEHHSPQIIKDEIERLTEDNP